MTVVCAVWGFCLVLRAKKNQGRGHSAGNYSCHPSLAFIQGKNRCRASHSPRKRTEEERLSLTLAAWLLLVLGRASHRRPLSLRLAPAPGFRQMFSHLSVHEFSLFFLLVIVLTHILQLNLYLREVWSQGGREAKPSKGGCPRLTCCFPSSRCLFFEHCWN